MGAGAGLGQLVLAAAADDRAAVLDVNLQGAAQAEQARLAIYQGQHLHTEGALELGVLEQPVEHCARLGVPLQLDDDGQAAPVGFVAQVADHLQTAVTHQGGDAFQDGRFVDLVGDLGDDDAEALAAAHLLNLGAGAHDGAPLAGGVGFLELCPADDQRAGGEVRPLDVVHQFIYGDVGDGVVRLAGVGDHTVNDEGDGGGDLAQVVRRDVGGHADGDAARAVDQQIGQPGGQHQRLVERGVEVGHEVHRVHADVFDQFLGNGGQPRLGVAHGRGAVAVNAAEVALPVHEHVAHGEGLGHAGHRVINRRVAVGVVLAEHLADDAGGLLVSRVGADAHVVHGVEDAAVHGLEAIAGVGQGAGHDDAHGVVEVRLAHLLVNLDLSDRPEIHGVHRGVS